MYFKSMEQSFDFARTSDALCEALIRFFLLEARFKRESKNLSKMVKMSDHFQYRTKTLIHAIELLDTFKSKHH